MFEEILCKTREEFGEVPMSPILHFAHIPDMGWRVEKECFLKLIFEPICRKYEISKNKYDWITEKHLGIGVFWTTDHIWEWLQTKDDYILKSDAEVLFKNAINFLNRKMAA